MVYDTGKPKLWEMCMNDGDCYRFWASDSLVALELAYLLNTDHFWFDEARKSEPFDLYLVSDKLSSERIFDRDWRIARNIQRDFNMED